MTAIFDIGKTNKKLVLLDQNHREVHSQEKRFAQIEDDDGYPCENLADIQQWIKEALSGLLSSEKYDVRAINFSAYGATLVHVEADGRLATPIYNYLRPFPNDLLYSFYQQYGDRLTLAKETASPPLGMLNAGLQLYWLKHTKPEAFRKIRYSLFLPNYLSWLFTGVAVNDYTSIGCHTTLWDFGKGDYHRWVYAEGIDRVLPPIVASNSGAVRTIHGKELRIGVGIHDSSAALVPYLRMNKEPFLLVSTGTWSITLNPFSQQPLNDDDLRNDCLNYMRTQGKSVRASRLFLGNEHDLQVARLNHHYGKHADYHLKVQFDKAMSAKLQSNYRHHFKFESIVPDRAQPQATSLDGFQNLEEAYHQLMMELMELQVLSVKRALGNTAVSTLCVDGGFARNQVFMKLLAMNFEEMRVVPANFTSGAALGAAGVVAGKDFNVLDNTAG